MRRSRWNKDLTLLAASTLLGIIAAAITLLYLDRLKTQAAALDQATRRNEREIFELQQAIFRFDVFFATDRILQTQVSNAQVQPEVRSLLGQTMFFDRESPFLFMAAQGARSPDAYAKLRDAHAEEARKARAGSADAYREMMGIEAAVQKGAIRRIEEMQRQNSEMQVQGTRLEQKRSLALLLGFMVQQVAVLCASLSGILAKLASAEARSDPPQ